MDRELYERLNLEFMERVTKAVCYGMPQPNGERARAAIDALFASAAMIYMGWAKMAGDPAEFEEFAGERLRATLKDCRQEWNDRN